MKQFNSIQDLKDTGSFPESMFSDEKLEYILESLNTKIEDSNNELGDLVLIKNLINIYKEYIDVENIYTLEDRFETVFIAEHDNVPYGFIDTGNLSHEENPEQILRSRIKASVEDRELIINRHHCLVKEVYKYCQSLNQGDIWCMVGGGSQLSVYFGNHTGYLAILHLSSKISRFYRTRIPKYTMQVNWEHNDKHFENKFNIEGTKLKLSRNWGK